MSTLPEMPGTRPVLLHCHMTYEPVYQHAELYCATQRCQLLNTGEVR